MSFYFLLSKIFILSNFSLGSRLRGDDDFVGNFTLSITDAKMNNYHTLPIRVYTEDTDCYGIVYYANYLNFAERGRTEALRTMGGDLAALQDKGIRLVVKSCFLNCLASARLNDVLEIRTQFKKPKHVRLLVNQTIVCEDRVIATLEVTLASINPLGKPIKLDAEIANTLWTLYGES